MNALHQMKGTIEALNCRDLEVQRTHLLTLVQELVPFHPNGNGNGNGHHGNGNGHGNGEGKHIKLSPREREVMNMILEGRRLKEIAAVLDISVKTVTTHRSRLLRKLSLEDNLGLYRYGVRHGLISV